MAKRTGQKVVTHKMRVRQERERLQNRYLMLGVIIVAVAVVGLIGYGLLDQNVLQGLKPVASVNGENIITNEFQLNVRYARWQLIQQYANIVQTEQMFGSDPSFAQYFGGQLQQVSSQLDNSSSLGDSVLTSMVDDRIIAQEAKKRGITVTDQEVEQEIQSAFQYYPNGTPTPTLTATVFDTPTMLPIQLTLSAPTLTPTLDLRTPTMTTTPTLALTLTPTIGMTSTATPSSQTASPTIVASPTITSTPYTLDGYKKSLQSYLDRAKVVSFTESELRTMFKYQIYRKKLMDAMYGDLKPEEEQVWARHILVADEASAQNVLERLKNGENWYAIAADVSLDTSNKDNGGDLGWFGHDAMDSAFSDAAFALGIGEISQPVKTQYGYHIIQVLGHEVRKLTVDELTTLRQQKFGLWISDALRSMSVVKASINSVKVPADPTLPPDLVLAATPQVVATP